MEMILPLELYAMAVMECLFMDFYSFFVPAGSFNAPNWNSNCSLELGHKAHLRRYLEVQILDMECLFLLVLIAHSPYPILQSSDIHILAL